jgi:hypothetical protein
MMGIASCRAARRLVAYQNADGDNSCQVIDSKGGRSFVKPQLSRNVTGMPEKLFCEKLIGMIPMAVGILASYNGSVVEV